MYRVVKRDFDLSKIGTNIKELQTYRYQRRPSHKDLSLVGWHYQSVSLLFLCCHTAKDPWPGSTSTKQVSWLSLLLLLNNACCCFHSSFNRPVPSSYLTWARVRHATFDLQQ